MAREVRGGGTVRGRYTKELQEVQNQVLTLGSMVEKAIDESVAALKARDVEWAKRIAHADLEINKQRFAIEELCLHILATQAPMAADLRFIAAVLNIITDLERMGDHAEGICKINVRMGDQPLLKPLIDIPRMAEKSRNMLRRALAAFVAHDVEAATQICHEDDEIDALHDQVFRELLTYMIEDPRTIQRATYLTWVSHNLERIADHVTNICERVVFMVTGEMNEINVSKY